MDKIAIEKMQKKVADALGVAVPTELLEELVNEVIRNEGCQTRTCGQTEITVFSYRRGSVCVAANVIEFDLDADEETEEEE